MATITQLPDDAIIIILENEISVEDILNFKSTCKRFQEMTLSNKFWERKYYQRCSTAKKKYNKEKRKKIFHHTDFKEILEEGLHCIQKFQQYTFLISEYKLYDTDKKQLEHILRSIAENSIKYYFVWDEINKIFAQQSCKFLSDFTRKYNFELIFYYLKQHRIMHKQRKFMNMPTTKSIFEKQLTIVAQYFHPHVSYSVVKIWLDGLAQAVLFRLKKKYPRHPICSTILEQFSFWSDNNIDDNFWSEIESRQIMCILDKYIFLELEIQELYQLLMISDFEIKHDHYIAESLQKYLLTFTYHSVARRLGIHTVLRSNGMDILVIWKSKYNTNVNNAEYFYLSHDLNPSNMIRRGIWSNNVDLVIKQPQHIWIILEMMEILDKNYRILASNYNIYCDWNLNIILNFLPLYLSNNKNIEIKYEIITNTVETNSDKVKRSLKRQTKKIRFAVGIIVKHSWQPDYNSPFCNHYGVIIGWHCECNMMFEYALARTSTCPHLPRSKFHSCKHSCDTFSHHAHQTHYILLADQNQICYAREDRLKMCPAKEIDNIEIGRYFSSFEGTHYMPNESLKEEYPEDTAAIAKLLAK